MWFILFYVQGKYHFFLVCTDFYKRFFRIDPLVNRFRGGPYSQSAIFLRHPAPA